MYTRTKSGDRTEMARLEDRARGYPFAVESTMQSLPSGTSYYLASVKMINICAASASKHPVLVTTKILIRDLPCTTTEQHLATSEAFRHPRDLTASSPY